MFLRAVLFFVVALSVCFAPEARAQSDMSAALAMPSNDNVFVPTSGWLVGPASLASRGGQGADAVEMPCVMMNQYNNGYVFRFSAGGNRVLAMAVDFRQSAFIPGNSYKVNVSVDPGFSQALDGTAYDEGTLILNLQKHPEFYNSLHQESILTLGIGGKKLSFVLLGTDNGLARIESCYSGMLPQQKNPPMHDAVVTPVPPLNALPAPSGKVGGMIDRAAGDMARIAPAAGAAIGSVGGIGRMPNPLSDEESAESDAPAAAIPAPRQGRPLAGNWASSSENRAAAKGRDIIDPALVPAMDPGAGPASGDAGKTEQIARFRAIRGTNLHEVLGAWAENINGRVIWQADRDDFTVKDSVILKGTFETAVANLLGQYGEEGERPVGRLYVDSSTGQKVLVIKGTRDM